MAATSKRPILFTGKLPNINAEFLPCIWIYLVRGPEVLAHVELAEDGTFSFALPLDKVLGDETEAVEVLAGPGNMKEHLARVSNLARLPIERAAIEKAERSLEVPTDKLELTDEDLQLWRQWCRRYCVSGVVVASDGCPVPGADVTVYTVGFDKGGFTKVPRATVTTDKNGHFTTCFCWFVHPFCFSCWPCWPFWWHCWPWWWELDMLHVIETLEKIPPGPLGPDPVSSGLQTGAVLLRPEGRHLIRGQGFAAFRAQTAQFKADPARTEIIQRKLSDARIREIFPWWWWCCDDPNIVFGATQNGVTIVSENPATATRWGLPSGSSVTLIANAGAVTACPRGPQPQSGFVWTRVGNITVDKINGGYADGSPGMDTSDLAFAGSLDIYGEFAAGAASYYQVNADMASGPSALISAELWNTVFISHNNGPFTPYKVKMGPFNKGNSLTNLYATQEARQAGPPPPGLQPFPSLPGDQVIWAYNGLKVSANASALIGNGNVGAVALSVVGYDANLTHVDLMPNAPLNLEIDTTDLKEAIINSKSFAAFKYDHSKAELTVNPAGGCTAWNLGPGGYVQVSVTVSDTNDHLWRYELEAEHGQGVTEKVDPGVRGYSRNPDDGSWPPQPPYRRPDQSKKSFGGGTDVFTYYPKEDCCYEFRIRAGKRVTNGYVYPTLSDRDFFTTALRVSA